MTEKQVIEQFFFEGSLYKKITDIEIIKILEKFLSGSIYYGSQKDVEGFNSINNCESTFKLIYGIGSYFSCDLNSTPRICYSNQRVNETSIHEIILKCKRYNNLFHFFIHLEKDETGNTISIAKVGQYPSIADLHIKQIHRYDKVLNKDKMKELTKAIGLAANGIGIGSFVYLRRIFEHLVFEAFQIAKKEKLEFDEDKFNTSKMDGKIKSLKGYLPTFLVENHSIYGILSKGIHELGEEDCRNYFTILRESIELILDEKLEQLQKDKKKKEISSALSKISNDIIS